MKQNAYFSNKMCIFQILFTNSWSKQTCILFDRKSKLAVKNSNKISIYYKEESSCCLASRWEKIGNRLSSLWLPWVWCKCACGVLYPIWKCSEMKLKLTSLMTSQLHCFWCFSQLTAVKKHQKRCSCDISEDVHA